VAEGPASAPSCRHRPKFELAPFERSCSLGHSCTLTSLRRVLLDSVLYAMLVSRLALILPLSLLACLPALADSHRRHSHHALHKAHRRRVGGSEHEGNSRLLARGVREADRVAITSWGKVQDGGVVYTTATVTISTTRRGIASTPTTTTTTNVAAGVPTVTSRRPIASTSESTTTSSPAGSCAPEYTGGQSTVRGTGTLPKPTKFVKRSGKQLLLDGKPYRPVGPNVYWLGLDEVRLIVYTCHFQEFMPTDLSSIGDNRADSLARRILWWPTHPRGGYAKPWRRL